MFVASLSGYMSWQVFPLLTEDKEAFLQDEDYYSSPAGFEERGEACKGFHGAGQEEAPTGTCLPPEELQ